MWNNNRVLIWDWSWEFWTLPKWLRHWAKVDLMMCHRLRRWPNFKKIMLSVPVFCSGGGANGIDNVPGRIQIVQEEHQINTLPTQVRAITMITNHEYYYYHNPALQTLALTTSWHNNYYIDWTSRVKIDICVLLMTHRCVNMRQWHTYW